ncbi:MAG: HEAT repeat domain-containing protein [Anaerolineae bacterium]|nr:HEAT repeat domain-containing protein [Anaerolineae bacterium]
MNLDEQTALRGQLHSADDTACEAAAVTLGQQGESGVAVLADLLVSAESDLRFWAVRGLWANASPEAVTLLIQALADQEELVRSGAALVLGELKAEPAVPELAHLLLTDPTASGNHAADALAKIGPPAAPVLIKALQAEQSWVRVRAAKALVPLESRAAIPALFHALDDDSYMVRHHAAAALARLGVGQMVYFRV